MDAKKRGDTMKKIKFILAATASVLALCSLFPNVMINSSAEDSYYPTIEDYTDGYIKIETGNIYDTIIAQKNFGYVVECDIYIETDGKDVGPKSIAFIPEYNYAEFRISETVDIDEAWGVIKPVLSKYSSFTCVYSESLIKECRHCLLKKNDNQSDEAFISETESLMKELKNTGYVYVFYSPGSIKRVQKFLGEFEWLIVPDNEKRNALLEYIDENLPNYSLTDENYLVPDSSLTIQERFDVVQQIYENVGVKPIFSSLDSDYGEVANGINLLEDFLIGDANGDNELNVSDCAFIARTLAKRETIDVTINPAADYNNDGKVTVSDAATIARDLAKKGL